MSLTTDFGVEGHHVGVIKGVILARNPHARIVDLCHGIAPGAVAQGAWTLLWSWHYFPPGTVHLAVVDPGVGSARRALVARAGGHFFVGPDNGVLDPVLREAGAAVVFALRLPAAQTVSATFHGRDVFAPAAARITLGEALSRLGAPSPRRVRLDLPRPRRTATPGVLRGEVIAIDRWGNLVTSLTAADLARERLGAGATIRIGRRTIRGIASHYAQARPGEALALVNSNGHLEIAVFQGSAASLLGASGGTVVSASRGKAGEEALTGR